MFTQKLLTEHCSTIDVFMLLRIAGYSWRSSWCIWNRFWDSFRFWWAGTCSTELVTSGLSMKHDTQKTENCLCINYLFQFLSTVLTYRLTLTIPTWRLTGYDLEYYGRSPPNKWPLVNAYGLLSVKTKCAVDGSTNMRLPEMVSVYRQIISGSILDYDCKQLSYIREWESLYNISP